MASTHRQASPLPASLFVVRLVALGRPGAEIGQQLGISAETVRVHVRNAMRKLGASTRAQAIGIAISTGEI